MPVRNAVRYHAPNTFYHVYNRGHNREALFLAPEDHGYFIFLLERCFGPKQLKSADGKLFPWFGDKIVLNAYCLMPNHFHLLLHQGSEDKAISKAMQSLTTTYSMYFNRKYKRRGSIFESVFKASPIFNDAYLQHITRYIHLNPKRHKSWKYSSYQDYLSPNSSWVRKDEILDLFDDTEQYHSFVEDYKSLRDELESLKYELADYGETY